MPIHVTTEMLTILLMVPKLPISPWLLGPNDNAQNHYRSGIQARLHCIQGWRIGTSEPILWLLSQDNVGKNQLNSSG